MKNKLKDYVVWRHPAFGNRSVVKSRITEEDAISLVDKLKKEETSEFVGYYYHKDEFGWFKNKRNK
jgi:hypothetical protein